jgi:OmpA-OmpF porin, OOP family
MNGNRNRIIMGLLALCLLAPGPTLAAKQGGKIKVKGFITAHTGNTLIVKTTDDTFTVVLSGDTKIQQPKGIVSTQKRRMSAADLIPGLKVTIEGAGDGEYRMIAKSISFDANDLQTAKMVQTGVAPTEQKETVNQQNIAVNKQTVDANKQDIEANKQTIDADRQKIAANKKSIEETQAAVDKGFAALAEEEVKAQATVNFAVGSTEISTEGQKELRQLARDAVSQKEYKIQVKGFADSSGHAAANQKLSQDRAQAVIAYLLQECNVPLEHIVGPGAMGISNPAASNETADGRAENRRVEVKVLVHRATGSE